MKFVDISIAPRRIVGVVADIDDEHVVPGPALTVYHPFDQMELWGGRLFVHTGANPYSLVTPVTRTIRDLSVDQPVERAATLDDVRAEVLTPDRLNTIVFGGFAAVALPIALVGVAGVLAFSVSGRIREFGIRLAIGCQPRHLLTGVIAEGAVMAVAGVVAGAAGGYALAAWPAAISRTYRSPEPCRSSPQLSCYLPPRLSLRWCRRLALPASTSCKHSGRTKHAAAKVGKQNWQCRPPPCPEPATVCHHFRRTI